MAALEVEALAVALRVRQVRVLLQLLILVAVVALVGELLGLRQLLVPAVQVS